MWVKICGTTNLEDARVAVEAGADALGFIFAESPRRITPEAAVEIVRNLSDPIEKVGVFVNESIERIGETVRQIGLTGVQLHGDDSLELAFRMAETAALGPVRLIPVLRAAWLLGGGFLQFGKLDTVLFDTVVEGKTGGTGKAWDWELGKSYLELLRDLVRIVVAGGLTPGNVANAIRTLRPWGVDVVSSVECEPGKKDPEKVRAFVKAAKQLNL